MMAIVVPSRGLMEEIPNKNLQKMMVMVVNGVLRVWAPTAWPKQPVPEERLVRTQDPTENSHFSRTPEFSRCWWKVQLPKHEGTTTGLAISEFSKSVP